MAYDGVSWTQETSHFFFKHKRLPPPSPGLRENVPDQQQRRGGQVQSMAAERERVSLMPELNKSWGGGYISITMAT